MNLQNQNHQPLRELVALSLVPKLGAHRIRLLLQAAGHPQDVFRMSGRELQAIDGIGPTIAGEILKFNQWEHVDRILEDTEEIGARMITCEHEAYPRLLKEIFDPPILLWVKGDLDVLNTSGIAVIGTRRASRYGLKVAEHFTKALVERGITIVSGLAFGIDALAHQTTIDAGGKTIAVLGSGIDNIYPRKHTRMAREIAEGGGAVISEFPPGTNPDAGNFPVRNRIVSGLSLGTLVVESGIKGGSMITARSALDQNREVFAIPHPLWNGNGEGCNIIIKRGWGKLVQTVEDVLSEVAVPQKVSAVATPATSKKWKKLELDELSVSICEILEESPRHIDVLSEELGEPSHLLLSKLLELEMQDCIQQKAGKTFELK